MERARREGRGQEEVKHFLSHITESNRKKSERILVFSELGISRAAAAIIAYLMKRNKCTLKVSHTPCVAMVMCGILAMSATNSRQDRQRFPSLSGFRGRRNCGMQGYLARRSTLPEKKSLVGSLLPRTGWHIG